jgi:hypothetical protein
MERALFIAPISLPHNRAAIGRRLVISTEKSYFGAKHGREIVSKSISGGTRRSNKFDLFHQRLGSGTQTFSAFPAVSKRFGRAIMVNGFGACYSTFTRKFSLSRLCHDAIKALKVRGGPGYGDFR